MNINSGIKQAVILTIGIIMLGFCIKSGLEMLSDTLSKILGEMADAQLANDIKATIRSFPDVSGAYDLILHNYGPDSYNGSVHVTVPDTMSMDELDRLTRKIQNEVYQKYNVLLTAVGIYSHNTQDQDAINIRENVSRIATSFENVKQMHGFYIDKEEKSMRFDIVVSFDEKQRGDLYSQVREAVEKEYPGYTIQFNMDMDFS